MLCVSSNSTLLTSDTVLVINGSPVKPDYTPSSGENVTDHRLAQPQVKCWHVRSEVDPFALQKSLLQNIFLGSLVCYYVSIMTTDSDSCSTLFFEPKLSIERHMECYSRKRLVLMLIISSELHSNSRCRNFFVQPHLPSVCFRDRIRSWILSASTLDRDGSFGCGK